MMELKTNFDSVANLTLNQLSAAPNYSERSQIVEASIEALETCVTEALKTSKKTEVYAAKYAALKRIIDAVTG